MHTMSFGDHLEELRKRLFLALAPLLPLFIVAFFLSDTLMDWLLLPVFDVLAQHELPPDLQVLSPPEFLLAKLKLSLIAAVIFSAWWLIYQVWLFVAPGLYQHERRFVYFLLPGSMILTILGVALLYFVMLPLMLHVLVMFAAEADIGPGQVQRDAVVQQYLDDTGEIPSRVSHPEAPVAGEVWQLVPENQLFVAVADEEGLIESQRVMPLSGGGIEQSFRVSFVISFALVLMLGVVIAFQMPLVIVLLGWMGLVSTDWLRKHRRYAMVICGVISAIITPADAASMVIMLLPLYGLYELGILLLFLAPASAVAEGTVMGLRFGRQGPKPPYADKPQTDKGPSSPVKADEPAQTEADSSGTADSPESRPSSADGGDDA